MNNAGAYCYVPALLLRLSDSACLRLAHTLASAQISASSGLYDGELGSDAVAAAPAADRRRQRRRHR